MAQVLSTPKCAHHLQHCLDNLTSVPLGVSQNLFLDLNSSHFLPIPVLCWSHFLYFPIMIQVKAFITLWVVYTGFIPPTNNLSIDSTSKSSILFLHF